MTSATVANAPAHREPPGIVKALTAQRRNRLFTDSGDSEIMSRGSGLPEIAIACKAVFWFEGDVAWTLPYLSR